MSTVIPTKRNEESLQPLPLQSSNLNGSIENQPTPLIEDSKPNPSSFKKRKSLNMKSGKENIETPSFAEELENMKHIGGHSMYNDLFFWERFQPSLPTKVLSFLNIDTCKHRMSQFISST